MSNWLKNYGLAKNYYNYYGNLKVPHDFLTSNGYEYDENGFNLGSWIFTQRYAKRGTNNLKLSEEQISLLNEIKMNWKIIDRNEEWKKNYALAKAYYEYYKNLEIPYGFITKNGVDYDKDGVRLGRWIITQKQAYKEKMDFKLSKEKISLLEKIGISWQNIDKMKIWLDRYELAKAYYDHFQNLRVPQRFFTKNGYEYDRDGVDLGDWIKRQRKARENLESSKLTEEQIQLLDKIGMSWDNRIDEWMNNYLLAEKYFKHYKSLKIPFHFKTKNGIDFDGDGVHLGLWIARQRKARSRAEEVNYITSGLSKKIELLDAIGMDWHVIDRGKDWDNQYQLAKNYYEHYCNLQIPINFKTKDGVNFDENGSLLGYWINRQRQARKGHGTSKISDEQITSLNQIGMIWDVKANEKKISEICLQNTIPVDINKKVLAGMSSYILETKISFLKDIGISLIDDNGKLHEIFSLSQNKIFDKYGMIIPDLMNNDMLNKLKKR